ncbi:MAG: hypothetical protein GXY06_08500 [Clostridiaceae bacterium]|mgnify:CR=1 FL=1|nr:hypothetical protein [Clostridiaceae bacterium]
MKNDFCRNTKRFSLLSLLLTVSILFSACSFTNRDRDTKDIEKAVESYLDELIDGTLADENYESEYADDTPLAEVYFADDAVVSVMHKVFELVDYEIGKVEGSEKDEEATCEVILTAPDVEDILDSLDEGFSLEDLEEALTDKKAPTEEHEIEFELEFDDEWIIIDTSEIAEILAEPFADISFGPNVEDAEAAMDAYLLALAEGDVDTINQIGDYYDADLIYNYESTPSTKRLAYYSMISFTSDGSPEAYTDYVSFKGTLSYPDSQAILNEVGSDVDLLAKIIKPELKSALAGEGPIDIVEDLSVAVEARMLELLSDPIYMLESEVEIDMYYDSSVDQWKISWLPTEVYSLATEASDLDYYLEEAKKVALEQLFADGEIDASLYDAYMYELFGIVNTTNASYTLDDLKTSFEEIAFYSWDLGEYVASFSAEETTQMSSDLYFYDNMTGAKLNYEFYFNDVLIDSQSGEVVPHVDGGSCLYFDFPLSSGSWTFEPGTYKAVFYTEAGELIAEATVEMI